MSSAQALWLELETGAAGGQGAMARRVAAKAPVDLFVAVEMPARSRVLYMEVNQTAVPKGTTFPRAAGFEMTSERAGQGRVRLNIRLLEPSAAQVFTILVDDVIAEMAAATTESMCIARALQRVTLWQDFLRKHGSEGLGDELQRALYGEIWFLCDQLLERGDAARAVAAWAGPTGANQDFDLPGSAFEVKTTIAGPHQRIRISNVRQLDDTGIGVLVLAHVSLDARTGGQGGESLPGIVARARTKLGERSIGAMTEFNGKLRDAGYLDAHAARYVTHFTPRAHAYFRVGAGFPRLMEADLPEGVGDVKYSIEVSMCRPFEMPAQEAEELMKRLANG